MNTYSSVDRAYQDLVEHILNEGVRQENRTGVDTKKVFGYDYQIDIQDQFPLLSLKDMGGGVFESMIAEFLWFLSGQHHIRDLKEHTSIWNQWADEDDRLDFSYGRFWRRFPIPDLKDRLPGEEWVSGDELDRYTRREVRENELGSEHTVLVFDQIAYILDLLENRPYSRRMVLTAWHPANCAVSNPPACHCMAVFNVEQREDEDDRLSCHLTIRSNDVGLGHPFNVAQYALLTKVLAKRADMKPGTFHYSGVDVHLYCDDDGGEYDQIDYARQILDRSPRSCPTISFPDRPIEEYRVDHFSLEDYDPHPHIGMKCVP